MNGLRIATRRSALALWQAEHVARRLRAAHPGLSTELVPMSTQGDEIIDTPLADVGGKALFTKALEQAMLDGRADVAVHSMKDVPAELPEGMTIAAILERDDPHDALVGDRYGSLSALPEGARVGTSSLRREFQLRRLLPGLCVLPLRGNVNTRLDKLDAGDYDALVLAAAGLNRLGLAARISALIDAGDCLPAIGQGAIGAECRADDDRSIGLLASLDHDRTRACVTAERAVNSILHGSCHAPLAAFATLDGKTLTVRARVGMPDGSESLEAYASGDAGDAQAIGRRAGTELLERGAGDILARLEAR